MTLTNSQFASSAACLAARCASWAGEYADNMGAPQEPMRDGSVERFVKMLRETADHIEERQAISQSEVEG
jgi:hypothetical protein